MTNRRNFYRLLHVQPEAPAEVIRSSFRALMKDCRQHPDFGGSNADAAILIEAYETLIDPGRRAEYDRETKKSFSRNTRSEDRKPPAASRRLQERMEKTGAIVFRIHSRKSSGQMLDLSPGGMLFLCGEDLPVGSIIQISSPLLAATASVTQCRKTQTGKAYSIGVKFIAVNFESPSGIFFSTTA